MSIGKIKIYPNRYGHRYQCKEISKDKVLDEEIGIKRIWAALIILGIIKKLNVPFFRSPNYIQGWRRDSL
jgi:hypothetical protein